MTACFTRSATQRVEPFWTSFARDLFPYPRLAAPLSVTVTAVMQHLQILEESGFVHTEKLGRVRTCRVDTAGFMALQQWINDHRTLWEQRLDRLGDFLELDEQE